MRFLIVDDFPTMRRIIRNLLKEIGYDDVVEAGDGVEALTQIEKGGVNFVLSDWNMPNMDGLSLLREIRGHDDPTVAGLPVMMITAEAKRENIIVAAQSGASGYVVKPFTAGTLQEKLTRILN